MELQLNYEIDNADLKRLNDLKTKFDCKSIEEMIEYILLDLINNPEPEYYQTIIKVYQDKL